MPRGSNLTREHQQKAQACRTRLSLSNAGKIGYQVTLDRHGFDVFLDGAARKRRAKGGSNLEKIVGEYLTERVPGFDMTSDKCFEVKVNGWYVDFVVRNFVIEVNGDIWHRNDPLHGRDAVSKNNQKYAALTAAKKIVIILPEDTVTNGEFRTVLDGVLPDLDF